jgi:hypothetical protein
MERKVNDSADTPCGEGCVVEETQHVCGKTCTNTYHYRNENGTCVVVEDCSSLLVGAEDIYPCGDTCFKDINSSVGEKCVSSCSNYAHYSSHNGICTNELIEDCSKRSINTSSNTTACGEGCVREEENYKCAGSCNNTNHYENVSGRCTLISECSKRKDNSSSTYPCGDGCFKDINSTGGIFCSSSCSNTAHIAEANGVCMVNPLNCTNRNVNISASTPCGDNCVKDTNDLCSESCSNAAHYLNINGTCNLISECSKRKVNSSPTYACGEGCFKEVGSSVGDWCGSGCSNTAHFAVKGGACTDTYLDCTERRVNSSITPPCGPKCFKDIDTADGNYCVSSCSSNYHYTNDSGICSNSLIEPCTYRIVNTSVFLPCGSEDCFQDFSTGNESSCVNNCSDNSKGVNGICKKCYEMYGFNQDSCSVFDNCYYKENSEMCVVVECESGYEINKETGVCEIIKTNEPDSEPESKESSFPWWIIVIIIVILVVVAVIIIIIIWRKKKNVKEKSSDRKSVV